MFPRFGALARFFIGETSQQAFHFRKFSEAHLGGRSSSLIHFSKFGCPSNVSTGLDHDECLSSQVWKGKGIYWGLRTIILCAVNVSRLGLPGSRLYCCRSAGATDDSGRQEMASPSCKDRHLDGGRYCVLLTGHASDYTERLYGGYSQLFVKLLGDPQDTWDVYPVVEGVFPTEEDVEKYDGFIITGSRHDAHGSEEWIVKLCVLLQFLHEKKRKMLGICFGHQVMSRALGGKTGRAEVGWEVGLRNVQLTDAMFAKPYSAGLPPVIKVYEVHRDQVQEIPPGGDLLAFSERTGIEMFSVDDNVLAIQGHPEFTEDIVVDLIDTRLSLGMLKEHEVKIARDSLQEGTADKETLQQLCKAFLKSGCVVAK